MMLYDEVSFCHFHSMNTFHFSPYYFYYCSAKEHVKFGVSRLGSGSHTMAQYLCSLHGKSTGNKNQYEIYLANVLRGRG